MQRDKNYSLSTRDVRVHSHATQSRPMDLFKLTATTNSQTTNSARPPLLLCINFFFLCAHMHSLG